MISLTIGLALAVSIAIGRVRKINIGLVAIPFAYIIGAFFMHIKPSDVIDLWPSHIFFAILAISLFFGFAMANGTLAEIAYALKRRKRVVSLGSWEVDPAVEVANTPAEAVRLATRSLSLR